MSETVLLIGLAHAVPVLLVGVVSRNATAVFITAVVMAAVGLLTGSPMYIGMDILGVLIGLFLAFSLGLVKDENDNNLAFPLNEKDNIPEEKPYTESETKKSMNKSTLHEDKQKVEQKPIVPKISTKPTEVKQPGIVICSLCNGDGGVNGGCSKCDGKSTIDNVHTSIYDENGFTREGIHRATGSRFSPDGYDKDGYDKDGFDKKGFNKNGIHKKTKSRFDSRGYDIDGYNKKVLKSQGFIGI